MKNAIEVNNLSKKYGSNYVFNNLSLSFTEGKVTGLLGPNGVGKSTLLKMLVGLVKPDSGTIKIYGEHPSINLNSQIAYLPDRAGWYKFQTVNESLIYADSIFTGFEQERACEMMQMMKLDLEMKVENLSRGQQACLHLIFCLARKVPLCLLDEPFSGIDLISRERIIKGIIDSIVDKDQTIIISTHEIYESESLFDKVIFLDEGNVSLVGDVEELRSQGDSLESTYRRLYR